jgi:hypothetical protein
VARALSPIRCSKAILDRAASSGQSATWHRKPRPIASDYSSLLLTTNQLEPTPSRRQSYKGDACAHLLCAAAWEKLTKFVTTMVTA